MSDLDLQYATPMNHSNQHVHHTTTTPSPIKFQLSPTSSLQCNDLNSNFNHDGNATANQQQHCQSYNQSANYANNNNKTIADTALQSTTTPSPIKFQLSLDSPQQCNQYNHPSYTANPACSQLQFQHSSIAFNVNINSNVSTATPCSRKTPTTTTTILNWDETTITPIHQHSHSFLSHSTPTNLSPYIPLTLSPIYPQTQPLPFLYTPPSYPRHLIE